MFIEKGASMRQLMNTECPSCASLRKQRCRVLSEDHCPSEDFKKPPFDKAPALCAFNVPRYYAVLHRARQYARANRLQLQWCVARDVPLHRDDRELPTDQLQSKRLRFLHRRQGALGGR